MKGNWVARGMRRGETVVWEVIGEAQWTGELTGINRGANKRMGKMEKAGGEGDEGRVVIGFVPRVIAGMYDAWVAQFR